MPKKQRTTKVPITYPNNNPLYKTKGYVAMMANGQSQDWKMGFIKGLYDNEGKYNPRSFIIETVEIIRNPERYLEREKEYPELPQREEG